MPVACGVLCSLCDMTGLTARQGQAPRANPGTLHTLWLRHLTVLTVVKSVLCLLFHRHNRFVEDEVQDVIQEREKGVKGERQHGLSISHQPIRAPPAMLVGSRCCFCLLYIHSEYTLISQDFSFQNTPLRTRYF